MKKTSAEIIATLKTKLFIDGQYVSAISGKKFPTYNPATEELLAEVD